MLIVFRLLARKARTFLRLPLKDEVLFFVACGLLGVARLAILTVPFRHIAPWLGKRVDRGNSDQLLDAAQIQQARRIGRLVRLASRHTPWQSRCLVQALVAKVLLARSEIPYTLYLGLTLSGVRGMQAHAWVSAGPVHVTGGDGFRDFTVVSAFISPESDRALQNPATARLQQ